ncbi:unnamed protein product [Bemisia tabaci]|uniref:Uncharacterized protein n=1 Tax=Bemisia tabaci TaxID=7038 RepID=A0A9P0F0V2_BEMTA|nr:unnamed protein product [Bemisia tabaci]
MRGSNIFSVFVAFQWFLLATGTTFEAEKNFVLKVVTDDPCALLDVKAVRTVEYGLNYEAADTACRQAFDILNNLNPHNYRCRDGYYPGCHRLTKTSKQLGCAVKTKSYMPDRLMGCFSESLQSLATCSVPLRAMRRRRSKRKAAFFASASSSGTEKRLRPRDL